MAAKPKKTAVEKSSERPKPKKTKTAVCLTDEALKRLGLACVDFKKDQSELIESLINQHFACYVLQVRGDRPALGEPEGQTNSSAPAMITGSASGAAPVEAQALETAA